MGDNFQIQEKNQWYCVVSEIFKIVVETIWIIWHTMMSISSVNLFQGFQGINQCMALTEIKTLLN